MTKVANDYYEAHGYPSDHREDKVNKTKLFNQNKPNTGFNNSSQSTVSTGLHLSLWSK